MLMKPEQSLFEAVTCGRCGGCGQYSFNLMHGTVCFGCNGQGIKLTKRGLAAKAYYDSLRMVKVCDVKVGDVVIDGGRKIKVSKSGPYEYQCWRIQCAWHNGSFGHCGQPDSLTKIKRDGVIMEVTMKDVKVGDLVASRTHDANAEWEMNFLPAVKSYMENNWCLESENKGSFVYEPDRMIVKAYYGDELKAMRAKALEYQAKLTKVGKLPKSKVAA